MPQNSAPVGDQSADSQNESSQDPQIVESEVPAEEPVAAQPEASVEVPSETPVAVEPIPAAGIAQPEPVIETRPLKIAPTIF